MLNKQPNTDFLVRTRPQLQLLSSNQIYQIHLSSLEVLERTGVEVLLPEAVELLKQAGAYVTDNQRVRIPSHLVEEALRPAPCRITISDRNGNPAMFLEGHNSYYGPGTDTTFVMDLYSGKRRTTKGDDVDNVALICDALPNIDFVACMGGLSANEVEPLLSDRHNFARMICHTTKPILFTTWSLEGLSDIYDMAVAVRGSAESFRRSPFIMQYAEPITPLQHAPESLQKLLFCAEKGIPVAYVSAPIMGATAPVTLAGTLILQNAEFLSGLVIAQLKQKGAPIIYGGGGTPMDMQSSVNIYNGPEAGLIHVADKEMASYYGLPDFNTGGCSDAKVLDQQAAMEAALSLFRAGLAGSSLIHDVGYLESGLTACWELIVLADEIIDEINYFLKGIDISEESLAVETIDKVGPGGNFLAEEHTHKHFKKIWYPRFINRNKFEHWVRDGSNHLDKVLNEKVKWILENHKPEPVSEEVKRKIDQILERAEGK